MLRIVCNFYTIILNLHHNSKWAATWQNQQTGMRPVWSESSLSAWRKLGSLATHWTHSEDADQTGRMPRLIWVFTGRTCHFVGFVMRRLKCLVSTFFYLFLKVRFDEWSLAPGFCPFYGTWWGILSKLYFVYLGTSWRILSKLYFVYLLCTFLINFLISILPRVSWETGTLPIHFSWQCVEVGAYGPELFSGIHN